MRLTCALQPKRSEEMKEVLIIGGGLAGLSLADALQGAGVDYQLLEARSRFGGRIKSELFAGHAFDLGPAWFWPGQPRIAALVEKLELARFDQYSDGILSYEDERGQVQRGQGYASMQGSWRLVGGLQRLIDALVSRLDVDRLQLNAQVGRLSLNAAGVTATLGDGTELAAKKVAIAMPPRLLADTIKFSPALDATAMQTMCDIPTWMAGQAKAVAVYKTPFWRADGLSGDAMSRKGPMVEIHDASPAQGRIGALFGFIGVRPAAREPEERLHQTILMQLGRLFGPEAETPEHLFVKDWASDRFSATRQDLQPLMSHPTYGLPHALQGLWDGRLVLAGTEVAPQFGGFLEGALEASERAAEQLL